MSTFYFLSHQSQHDNLQSIFKKRFSVCWNPSATNDPEFLDLILHSHSTVPLHPSEIKCIIERSLLKKEIRWTRPNNGGHPSQLALEGGHIPHPENNPNYRTQQFSINKKYLISH